MQNILPRNIILTVQQTHNVTRESRLLDKK